MLFKQPIGGLNDLMLNNRKAGDGRQQIADRFRNVSLPIQAGVREVVRGLHRSLPLRVSGLRAGAAADCRRSTASRSRGPDNPTGAVSTEGRKLLYVCDPKVAGEAPCAKQIAAPWRGARSAARVTEADLGRLMPFYEARARSATSIAASNVWWRRCWSVRISCIARFAALSPRRRARVAPSPIMSWRRACRSSCGILGRTSELFKLAASRDLSKPAVLDAQVTRMLADPKASSLATNFAMKWLGLDRLDGFKPDERFTRPSTTRCGRICDRGAERSSVSSPARESSDCRAADSDRTYLNDCIARHYGITASTGRSSDG